MKVSPEQAMETHKEICEIRQGLLNEADLLSDEHDPRLVMYATITAAMHQAHDLGYSPDTFCKLVAATMELYTDELPRDD